MIEMEKMQDCFSKVYKRVIDSLEITDLDKIFDTLKQIKEPTIITGVGGSSVVCSYLESVLNKKNHILTRYASPRDISRMDLVGYKNIIAVSYSGGNVGVDVSFENDLNKYLFSKNERENIIPLRYNISDLEMSYISISATLLPMAILYLYYSDNDLETLKEMLQQNLIYHLSKHNTIEVLYGLENKTSTVILESTLTEAGLASCVLHDKYNYCHGRMNLNKEFGNLLVYFESNSELDSVFKENLNKHYKEVITIKKQYDDDITNDYYNSYQMLLMCKELAEKKNIDLSSIIEDPINNSYYLFKGTM